jgi:hypothetical protein
VLLISPLLPALQATTHQSSATRPGAITLPGPAYLQIRARLHLLAPPRSTWTAARLRQFPAVQCRLSQRQRSQLLCWHSKTSSRALLMSGHRGPTHRVPGCHTVQTYSRQLMIIVGGWRAYSTLNPIVGMVVTTSPICPFQLDIAILDVASYL